MPFAVEGDGVAIRVRLRELASSPGALVDDEVYYPATFAGKASTYVQRVTKEGTEDFLVLDSPPAQPQVEYDVFLDRGVEGLRLVDGVLEFVGTKGTPRMRMSRPVLETADGKFVEPRVSLLGCAADTDARPPWGRAPVAPGATECRVRLDWSDMPVTYPVLVDPEWVNTAAMVASGRKEHAMSLLDDGRVLVTGGGLSAAHYFTSNELYDPATRTWAVTGSFSKRQSHTQSKLLDGRVAAIGGGSPITSGSAWNRLSLYTPATGTWVDGTPLITSRILHTATVLADGKVFVTGGQNWPTSLTATEAYDPVANTWTARAAMSTGRSSHAAERLHNDRVLVAGGWTGAAATASAQVYDPVANTWATTGSLATARYGHSLTRMSFDLVVAAGGTGAAGDLATAELYTPITGFFTPTLPAMASARTRHTAVALEGDLLLVGGKNGATTLNTVTRYGSVTNTWGAEENLPLAKEGHRSLKLNTGEVLTAGAGSAETWGSPFNPEQPSALPVKVEWLTGPGVRSASDLLSVRLTNSSGADKTVTVQLTGRGLDERSATRLIGTYTVGTTPLTVTFPAGNLPVQSVGTQAQAEVRVELTQPSGVVHIPSPPMHYEFANGYATVTLFGSTRKAVPANFDPRNYFTLTAGELVVTQASMMALLKTSTEAAFTNTGRVWNGTSYTEMASLPPNGGDGGTVTGMVPLDLDLSDLLANTSSIFVASAETGTVQPYTVCNNWRGVFIDSGFSESYGANKERTLTAAQYATFMITRRSDGALVANGNFTVLGCSVVNLRSNTDYVVSLIPKLKRLDGAELRANYGDLKLTTTSAPFTIYPVAVPAGSYKGIKRGTSLVVSTGVRTKVGSSVGINAEYQDSLTRAMAAATLVFGDSAVMPAGGKPLRVLTERNCADVDTLGSISCGADPTLYIGPGHSLWKFIVAHEIGHVAQRRLGGLVGRDYYDHTPLPALCTCAHASPATFHCLSGVSFTDNAQDEGFAHFIAARAWNDLSANKVFVYYKQSYRAADPLGVGGLESPPAARYCGDGLKWEETNCAPTLSSDLGVEWDWLNFFVGTATGVDAITPTQIGAVYRRACGGNCNDEDRPTWSTLKAAAVDPLADGGAPVLPTLQQRAKFTTQGDVQGVDH
ncbi:MAG: hypothetical protein IPG50_30555 [Myxococcales bacterium]|nr:hypothetical protein [Myxococcales bacterium]